MYMDNTPKTMAMQLGAFISLFTSIGSLLVLLFSIINLAFPDAAESYYSYNNYQDSIRYAIAMLVVFFPTFITLTRKVNVARRNESGLYLTITKWLVYFALLIGGLVILGDLVAVIMAFLNGELTTRFILKALSLFVVVGAAFWYYQKDATQYWNTREKQSVQLGILTSILVMVTVVYGYMQIDSPSVARDRAIDEEQVSALSDMQWRIEEYYRANEVLPENIETVYGELTIPTASEGRGGYRYVVTGEQSYELCADFMTERQDMRDEYSIAIPDKSYNPANYNWEHGVGNVCFTRTVLSTETLKD